MQKECKAVILSGGKSRRIGKNKSFLSIGNTILLDLVINKLNRVFDDIYIITDKPSKYQALGPECLVDIFPEKGPLGGIYSALELIDTSYVFVFACDMPFLNTSLIKSMIGRIDKRYDAIVPLNRGYAEPLHAIYSQSSKETILNYVVQNQLSVHSLFNKISTLFIREEETEAFGNNMFFNINVMEDYKKALDIVGYGAKN